MIRNPLNARGFTLIEVLVALSVLGVTMAAAAGLLRTGLRLRAEARDHLAFERDARAFVGALRDDCANLVAAAPGPLVSSDALVLWRAPDGSADGTAQIVSYQWSVSTTGDSLLVRVAAPMQAAATDPDAIREECRRWIGLAGESGETGLLIRQDGGRRFGERAERPGLTGSWVGYPAIGAAAFAQGEGYSEDPEPTTVGAQIGIKLAALDWEEGRMIPDPRRRFDLLPVERGGVAVTLRLLRQSELAVPGGHDLGVEGQP